MIKNGSIILLLLLYATTTMAQKAFRYKTTINAVDSNGFYAINLQPLLISKCKGDLSDIRIIDAAGKTVPYILGSQLNLQSNSSFVVFPEIKQGLQPDSTTNYVAKNITGAAISQLYIKLRNAQVQRSADLSGSDDLKTWYAIKENIHLEQADLSTQGTYQQSLSFPPSIYHYLRLKISHKNKEPISILQAGVYRQQTLPIQYIQLPQAAFSQKDSAGISYITLRFNEAYQVNKLQFNLTGLKYYKRPVSVYQGEGKDRQLVASTELNSSKPPSIYLSCKSKVISIEINNDDNPSLSIKSIASFQHSETLVAYLLKANVYNLFCGNSHASTPHYDLQSFTDSIHSKLPVVLHGILSNNFQQGAKTEQARNYGWLIWLSVGIVLLLLILLTLKMTKEVSQRSAKINNTHREGDQ